MYYEKRNIQKLAESRNFHNAMLLVVAMVIAGELLYIYAPDAFWAPISFIDLINALAQLATAGAFFFGIYQYKKSRNSERQTILIKECRDLITGMQNTSSAFVAAEQDYKSCLNFMSEMSAQAGNFNIIFKELNEDVHKAIVRMHWQDMYFGKLPSAMNCWTTSEILKGLGVSSEDHLLALAKYTQHRDSAPPLESLEAYHQAQFLLRNTVSPENKVISSDRYIFFFFQNNLFVDDELRDQLYGTLNKIEANIRAPILAAVNDTFNSTLNEIFLKQKLRERSLKRPNRLKNKWNS